MKKIEFNMSKELLDLAHKYKMEEIEVERKSKLEVERIRHENEMSQIRLKTANMRAIEESKRGIFKIKL